MFVGNSVFVSFSLSLSFFLLHDCSLERFFSCFSMQLDFYRSKRPSNAICCALSLREVNFSYSHVYTSSTQKWKILFTYFSARLAARFAAALTFPATSSSQFSRNDGNRSLKQPRSIRAKIPFSFFLSFFLQRNFWNIFIASFCSLSDSSSSSGICNRDFSR